MKLGFHVPRTFEVQLIFLVKRLLYTEKYTIEGARQKLRQMKKEKGGQLTLSFDQLRNEDFLYEVRRELHEVLSILNDLHK